MNETLLIVQSSYHSQVFKALNLIETNEQGISTFQKGIFMHTDHYTSLRHLLGSKRVWLKTKTKTKKRKLIKGGNHLRENFIPDNNTILVYTNVRKWLLKGKLKGDTEHIINHVLNGNRAEVRGTLDKLTFKRYIP